MGVAVEDLLAEGVLLLLNGVQRAGRSIDHLIGRGRGCTDLEVPSQVGLGIGIVGEGVGFGLGQRGHRLLEGALEDLSGNRAHPLVERLAQAFQHDAGSLITGQPGCAYDGFEPDAAVRIVHSLTEQVLRPGDLMGRVAQHVGRGRPGLMGTGIECGAQQAGVGLVLGPGGPQGFAQVAIVEGILAVELRGPGLHGRDDLRGRTTAQLATRAVAGAVLGRLQVLEQLRQAGTGYFRRRHQRARRVGHPVNAAMVVVALRIAGVVLHVPDEGVVPVEEVQRAIWSELEVHRAEVRIAGADEVAGQGAGEPGSVFAHRAEVETQEPNAVAGHELTLPVFREMPGGDELRARGGPRPLGHILARALDFHAIRHLGRDGQTPVILAAGGVGQHALLPVIEGDAPGVVDVALDGALQAEVLRIEAPGAAVVHALRTVGRLDLAVQEAALEQIERA